MMKKLVLGLAVWGGITGGLCEDVFGMRESYTNSARQALMLAVDNILITSELPKDNDVRVLADECYKENPSFGAWDLRISYITDGMESNQLVKSFVELFMQEILAQCNSISQKQ